MEPNTTPAPEASPPSQPLASQASDPKRRRGLRLALIGLALLLVGAVVLWLVNRQKDTPVQSSAQAETTLFEMFTTAATKDKIHLTYAERKFNSPEDRQKNVVSNESYSVAEADSAAKDFRSVYITRSGSSSRPSYSLGRCLNGQVYVPQTTTGVISSLSAAESSLRSQSLAPLPLTDDGEQPEGCQLTDARRNGRLTDGIIPLGLNTTQANGWLKHLKAAQFLIVKNEGNTTYKDTPVQKIRLVTNSLAGVGSFYEAVKSGAGLQLTDPESGAPGPDAYRLDDIPSMDNLDGFYLIDKQTKLPVYSEFTTASLLNNKSGYVFKQAYQYPEQLSLSTASQLEILQ